MIRKATTEDIKALTKLLYQADAVHNGIRPDLFKSDTPKYNAEELAAIINDSSKPIFVYDDGEVVGHAFCQITEVRNHRLLQDIKTLYIPSRLIYPMQTKSALAPSIKQRNYGMSKMANVLRHFEAITPKLSVWHSTPPHLRW